MPRHPRKYFRNRLDLNDSVQVRTVRRRLRLSEPELKALVDKVGNSMAGLSKEVELRRAKPVDVPKDVPTAAVIEATASQAPGSSSALPVSSSSPSSSTPAATAL